MKKDQKTLLYEALVKMQEMSGESFQRISEITRRRIAKGLLYEDVSIDQFDGIRDHIITEAKWDHTKFNTEDEIVAELDRLRAAKNRDLPSMAYESIDRNINTLNDKLASLNKQIISTKTEVPTSFAESCKLLESVLDPINKTRCSDIFDKNDKMLQNVRKFITDIVDKFKEHVNFPLNIRNIYMIGSSTGYQYSLTSDVDIEIELGITENQKWELLPIVPKGTLLPGTQRPINLFILCKNESYDFDKAENVYDLARDKWIKKTGKKNVDIPYQYIKDLSTFFMNGCDLAISNFERDVRELDEYIDLNPDTQEISVKEKFEAIDRKLVDVKNDVDQIKMAHHVIFAFENEGYEGKPFKISVQGLNDPDPRYSVNNLIYKMLDRHGYNDKMKDILKTGLAKIKDVEKYIADNKKDSDDSVIKEDREYDKYVKGHIKNLKTGYAWMKKHLPELFPKGYFNADSKKIRSAIRNHDKSKWGKDEYKGYADFQKVRGMNLSDEEYDAKKGEFNVAWNHHQKQNKHHWQYWVLTNANGTTKALDMPYENIIEMICDWWTFSWKENNMRAIFDWYSKNKDSMILSPKTRSTVENILSKMKKKIDELEKESLHEARDTAPNHCRECGCPTDAGEYVYDDCREKNKQKNKPEIKQNNTSSKYRIDNTNDKKQVEGQQQLFINDSANIRSISDIIDEALLLKEQSKTFGLTTKKEDLPDVQTGEAFKVTFYDNGEYVGEASVSDDYDGDKLCFAYNIEVKKDLRGQGYGTKIMKYMIDKYHIKSLQVAPDNDVAIHLYKKLGFKKTGEVRMSKTRVDDRMELPSKKRLDEEICYEQTLNEDLRTFMISKLPDKMINKLFLKMINNILNNKNVPNDKKDLLRKNMPKLNVLPVDKKRELLKDTIRAIKESKKEHVERIEKELKVKLNKLTLSEEVLNEDSLAEKILGPIFMALISILGFLSGNIIPAIIFSCLGALYMSIGIMDSVDSKKQASSSKDKPNEHSKQTKKIDYDRIISLGLDDENIDHICQAESLTDDYGLDNYVEQTAITRQIISKIKNKIRDSFERKQVYATIDLDISNPDIFDARFFEDYDSIPDKDKKFISKVDLFKLKDIKLYDDPIEAIGERSLVYYAHEVENSKKSKLATDICNMIIDLDEKYGP